MSFHPVDVHVGQRVKIRRKSLKLTQQELGDKLGLTFQQVQKYERGANRISASKLYIISQTLDVSISYFFEDIEDNIEPAEMREESPGFDGASTKDVLQFASSMEGIELNRAFTSISDDETRRQLVSLFDAIAKNPAKD